MAETREESETTPQVNLKEQFNEICEGKAKILFPKGNTVFYNNVQVFNRDLSVAVIKLFSKIYKQEKEQKSANKNKQQDDKSTKAKREDDDTTDSSNQPDESKKDINITVLEALSASGLRAIRYALEIPILTNLIANDLSKEAVTSIERNIKHNGVGDKVKSSLSDARFVYIYIYKSVPLPQQEVCTPI